MCPKLQVACPAAWFGALDVMGLSQLHHHGSQLSGTLVILLAGYRLDPPALRVLFNRFDPSGSGSLQLTEFLALTLFMRSATATFNAFDANRVGTITLNFNQFIYSW